MRKGLIILAAGGLLAILLWAGCKTTRAGYESPKYRVVDKDGVFETRDYPALIVAETSIAADGQGMNLLDTVNHDEQAATLYANGYRWISAGSKRATENSIAWPASTVR